MLQNTQFGMSGPSAPVTETTTDFEILTTAPRMVLAVTPHPDDCEGGCGGALARWIKEFGTEAVVVMCTNGNKGTQERDLSSERLAAIREQEQLAASEVIGAKEVVFLRYPDGGLEDTMLFRSQVVREIRRHKPDVIMSIDPFRSTSHHPPRPPHERAGCHRFGLYLRLELSALPGADHRRRPGAPHGGAGLFVGQRVAPIYSWRSGVT